MTAANGNDSTGMLILHGAASQEHGGFFNPPCSRLVGCNRDSSKATGDRQASEIWLDG